MTTTSALDLSRWHLFITVSLKPCGHWAGDIGGVCVPASRPDLKRSIGFIEPRTKRFRHLTTHVHGDTGVPEAKQP